MLNVNRATLVGHTGRDPELRDLKNGGKAATFTLATTEKWTDREGRPGKRPNGTASWCTARSSRRSGRC